MPYMKLFLFTHTESTHECVMKHTNHAAWTHKAITYHPPAWKILTFSSRVTFSSKFMHHAHMPGCTHYELVCVHACMHTHIHTRGHTNAAADISEELQRIQGVESHFVKEDQTAGNENHWPSPVTEFTICAWNQLEEERKQRKLAGEGNVWASINRKPMFEMILKGMQVIYYSAPCLSHTVERVKEIWQPCLESRFIFGGVYLWTYETCTLF